MPKGYITRSAYTKKAYVRKAYTRKNGTRVKAAKIKATRVRRTLVPDKGLPGKTPKSKRVLPKLKKGTLSVYGYQIKKNSLARRRAILKMMRRKGGLVTLRHLVVLRSYNKNSTLYSRLNTDVKFAQKYYRMMKARNQKYIKHK